MFVGRLVANWDWTKQPHTNTQVSHKQTWCLEWISPSCPQTKRAEGLRLKPPFDYVQSLGLEGVRPPRASTRTRFGLGLASPRQKGSSAYAFQALTRLYPPASLSAKCDQLLRLASAQSRSGIRGSLCLANEASLHVTWLLTVWQCTKRCSLHHLRQGAYAYGHTVCY